MTELNSLWWTSKFMMNSPVHDLIGLWWTHLSMNSLVYDELACPWTHWSMMNSPVYELIGLWWTHLWAHQSTMNSGQTHQSTVKLISLQQKQLSSRWQPCFTSLRPVWNLWAVIWFHFTFSSLVFLPTPIAFSDLSIFCLLAHSPDFFQKILQYFSLRWAFWYGSCLGEVSWSMVCAACCHMTLVFAKIRLWWGWFFFPIVVFLSIPFFQQSFVVVFSSGID